MPTMPGCDIPKVAVTPREPLVGSPVTFSVQDAWKWKNVSWYVKKCSGGVSGPLPSLPDTPSQLQFNPSGADYYTVQVVASPVATGVKSTYDPNWVCPTSPRTGEKDTFLVSPYAGAPPPPNCKLKCKCTGGRKPTVRDWLEPRYMENAEKGDAVVMTNPGFTQIMLNAIGYEYSHTLMITGNCTTHTQSNETTEYTSYNEERQIAKTMDYDNFGIPRCKVHGGVLNGLAPGKRFSDFGHRANDMRNAGILKPFNREAAVAAADRFRTGLNGLYKMSEFSTFDFQGGTTCSGAVAHAWDDVAPGSIQPMPMTPPERYAAANLVHSMVVQQLMPTLKQEIPGLFDNLFGIDPGECADKLANQIVNCFAAINCYSNEPLWRDLTTLGSGASVGPDALIRGRNVSGRTQTTAPYMSPIAPVIRGGVYNQYLVCESPDDPTDVVRAECEE
jgi:hypothetical protein